jgi:hypothetical protein
MDGIMILTFLAIIFSRFRERVGPAQGRYHFVSHMVGILYSSACESGSSSEKRMDWRQKYWFYFLFFVILTFMLINTNKN